MRRVPAVRHWATSRLSGRRCHAPEARCLAASTPRTSAGTPGGAPACEAAAVLEAPPTQKLPQAESKSRGKPVVAAVGVAGTVGIAGLAYAYWQKQQRDAAEAAAREAAELAAREAAAREAAEIEALAQEVRERDRRERDAREREAARELAAWQQRVAAELSGTLAAAGPGALGDAVDALRQALQQVGQRAQADRGAEVSALAAKATSRLALHEQAVEARESYDAACSQLRQAIPATKGRACRAALSTILEARRILSELEEELPIDGDEVAEAMARLDELEQLEHEADLRAEVLAGLEKAVISRDPALCREAVSQARSVGLEMCPAMEIAGILSEPSDLLAALVSEGTSVFADQREAGGLTADDFSAAAEAAGASMTEVQLCEQAAQLAASILRNHRSHVRELEGGLQTVKNRLTEACSMRVHEALGRFVSEKDGAASQQQVALEAEYQQHTDRTVEEANARVADQEQVQSDALRQNTEIVLARQLEEASEDISHRVGNLVKPVDHLRELLQAGHTLQQRSQASNALSTALLALEGALVEGRASGGELKALQRAGTAADGFVPRLLSCVPPETMVRSCAPLPTEPHLCRRFCDQLNGFMASALAPSTENIVGRLLGRVLGSMYVLRAAEASSSSLAPAAVAAQQNLLVLQQAAVLVERGDVRGALATMEALTGNCRARALSWIEDARHTLLVQQAARAVQARARCMNATLL